jgi:sulfur carrier protein ThiS
MKIKVKLYGLLPRRFPDYDSKVGMEVHIPDGATVEDFLVRLGIPQPEAELIIVNGSPLRYDSKLKDRMCLHLFNVISGG